jgi:hypothetical protein
MVLPVAARVVLIAVFCAVGLWHLLRCLSGSARFGGAGVERVVGAGTDRANDLVHLLMGVEMVAMIWGGPRPDPWDLQLTVFAVATGWFAVQAIGVLPVSLVTTDAGRPDGRGQHVQGPAKSAPRPARVASARSACAQHAIVAAAMTWMIAAMPVAGGSGAARPAVHMSGMAMPAVSGLGHAAISPYLGALLGGYLLLTTPWWLAAAHRKSPGRQSAVPRQVRGAGLSVRRFAVGRPGAVISHAVMAAAMGAVLLVVQ